MALQIWLPLNGNLENYGVSGLKFSNASPTIITSSNDGKIGSCYKSSNNASHEIVSDKTINLGNYVSMFCWVKPDNFYETANLTGVLGQHRYSNKTGLGITLRRETESTGHISITTGNGDGRTYVTYYGSTILSAGTWYHVGFTYDNGAIKLYVNGNIDKTATYVNLNVDDYIQLFEWSFAGTAIAPSMGVGYGLKGSLNDVRIYDHCLSEKEVKELSKGLVVHYKLNDQDAETTVNAATMATITTAGWNAITYTKTLNDTYAITHKTTADSFWTTLNFDIGAAYVGKTVTVSATVTEISHYYTDLNGRLSVNQKQESGTYPTYIENLSTSWRKDYSVLQEGDTIVWSGTVLSTHTICFELWDNITQTGGYTKLTLRNVQIEEKNHKTAYARGSRGQLYDNTIYTEPDGTKWVRIAHHNNPANALFASTDNWSYGVYKDADRWLDIYPIMYRLSSYEFMVKQKTTSSATEIKYRWIQNKNPLTAVYADVAPAAVTRITTAGYTDGGYGGLYILNSNTHFVIANASKGNWYGAFGCWTTYQGGIPGYPNTLVTTGYMDLYVRITESDILKIHDSSGFKNDGDIANPVGLMVVNSGSPKYTEYLYIPADTVITHKNVLLSGNDQEWTCCAWIYPTSLPNYSYLNNFNQGNRLKYGTYPLLYLNSGTNDYYTYGSQAITLGTWQHIAFVFRNSDALRNVYVNGVLTNSTGPNKTSTPYGIGDLITMFTGSYAGYVSDYREYCTALSAADIKELYNLGASVDNKGNVFAFEIKED